MTLISCKKDDSNLLIGSWSMDRSRDPNRKVIDSLTFFENGKATLKIYINNKLTTNIKATYVYNNKSRLLKINSPEYIEEAVITKLDENFLVTEPTFSVVEITRTRIK